MRTTLTLACCLSLFACANTRDPGAGKASTGGANPSSEDGDGGGGGDVVRGSGGERGVGGGGGGSDGTGGVSDGSGGAVNEGGASAGATGGAPAAGPTHIKVKVLSYNVLTSAQRVHSHPWTSRLPVAIAMWTAEDPDLVGTQETQQDQLHDFDHAFPDYARIGVGAANGLTHGETDAIYYKKARFHLVDSGTFWLSATPDVAGSASFGNTTKREVVWGEFKDKDTGTKFFHFNTHFDNASQNSRNKSAELLIQRIQAQSPALPFVVTGDFNANEKNETTLYLEGKGNLDGKANPLPLIDSFRARHPNTHEAGTYGDFIATKTNGSKIDYVYMGPGVTASHAAIDRTEMHGEFPSDHWEIEAVVKIPVTP